MSDNRSKEARSYNMSRVRGKDTKPELLVRKFLFSNGLRFRLHSKSLPGKPDIVLPKYKAVIFVQGCFWHGHAGCKYATMPKTRTDWWTEKINGNVANDKAVQHALVSASWTVFQIWGCDLKKGNVNSTLEKLVHEIKNRPFFA